MAWVIAAVVLTGVMSWILAWDLIPWLRGPAPFPPEWDWPYVPLSWVRLGTYTHVAALIVYPLVAGLYFVLCWPMSLWAQHLESRLRVGAAIGRAK